MKISLPPMIRNYLPSHKNKSPLRLITFGLFVVFALMIVGFLASVVMVGVFSSELPSPTKLTNRQIDQSTKILDRNGKLLYDIYGNTNRTLVTLDQVSPYVIQATLATEDAEFYLHQGFDPRGFVRAMGSCIIHMGCTGGGSTLTQQVVKNTLLTSEKSITRKIKEFVLSMQIEKKYTKDEILQMYLNEAPYGGQSVGIEAASQTYFGKKSSELTLAEASLLAGLTQSPSYYSPYGAHPEYAKDRQAYVLKLMTEKGWVNKDGTTQKIAADTASAAKEEALVYNEAGGQILAPHFVMYVKSLLTDQFGEGLVDSGGLQVTTTLDLDMQNALQKIVTDQIAKDEKPLGIGNGAAVAEDPKTGQILAMVGSRNYFDKDYDGKVNVTLSLRQPGSSIKPITYATALSQGYTAASVLYDVQTTFTGNGTSEAYTPVNYDGKFRGPVQIRSALANSLNIPAVKMLKLVGINNMIKTASDLGIDTFSDPSRYGLSLTLGGGEVSLLKMAGAYATLADGGQYRQQIAILKVTDSKGNLIYSSPSNSARKVLDPGVAFIISDILSDNVARSAAFGSNSTLVVPGHTVAVKTGTTNDLRDNWTLGYTPNLVVGVWVGNNDNSQMKSVASGISGASDIWNQAMKAFLKDKKDESFKVPDNVSKIKIDEFSGALPSGDAPTREEYFVKGTEPTLENQMRRNIEICKTDGKIASQACRDAKQTEEKTYFVLTAELPEWQEAVDKWIEDNHKDDEQYHPPKDVSTSYFNKDGERLADGGPLVIVTSPEVGTKVKVGGKIVIEANVSTPYAVTKVEFFVDGEKLGDTVTSIPYQQAWQLAMTAKTGSRQIRVRAEDSAGNDGSSTINVQVVS